MRLSLTYTLEPSNLRRLGSTALPSSFTARFEFETDHTVELDIAVAPVDANGTNAVRPICEAVRVLRNPDLPPLTGQELRKIPLANWIEFACVEASMRPSGPGVLEPVGDNVDDRAAALGDIQESRRRRRITDELLQNVATVYDAAAGDHAAEQVRDAFHVSISQAHRYIAAARDRGFLGGA